MRNKRNKHGSKYKAQVAVEAAAGDKTMAELSRKYGVHANQIGGYVAPLQKTQNCNDGMVRNQNLLSALSHQLPTQLVRLRFSHLNQVRIRNLLARGCVVTRHIVNSSDN